MELSPLKKRLLKSFLNHKHPDEMLGDYEEIYRQVYKKKGRLSAGLWFGGQVTAAAFPSALNSLRWSMTMLLNSIKITWRQMNRHKGFSVINILGLAVGMACFMLVGLYGRYENSYDGFHDFSHRLYRVMKRQAEGTEYEPYTPLALGPAVLNEVPEAESAVRIQYAFGPIIKQGTDRLDTKGLFADENFLKIFSFPLEKGDIETALSAPFSLVITPELAERCFGNQNPLGKTLTQVVRGQEDQYRVTGILKHKPGHSHLSFDMLISMSTVTALQNMRTWWDDWDFGIAQTYIRVHKDASLDAVETKIFALLKRYTSEKTDGDLKGIRLQKISEIHLRPRFVGGSETRSLRLLYCLGLAILVVASVNYVNLSTARSVYRMREIGVRKVVGARRGLLMKQFLGESTIIAGFAFLGAVFLVLLTLPSFNSFMEREMAFNFFRDIHLLAGMLGMVFLVGFLSGIYPAVLLSSFKPVSVLRNMMNLNSRKGALRNALVSLQFALSILLIFATAVVLSQLKMMKTADLGWDKENLVEIWLDAGSMRAFSAIKAELLRNPEILSVSVSGNTPYYMYNREPVFFRSESGREIEIPAVSMQVGCDYPEVFGMEIVQGRSFSPDWNEERSVLVNQTLVKRMGVNDPVGRILIHPDGGEKEIIGVLKDFHHASFHHVISPLIYTFNTSQLILFIRLRSRNTAQALEVIKKTITPHILHDPFKYSFVEDKYDLLYQKEQRLGVIFKNFSLMAVFLACLGLFGLAMFAIERRVKELAIRKVLGAGCSDLILILSKEFLKLVALANLISWPLGFLLMKGWLQNYSFRIPISLWFFLFSGGSALFIACITIGYHTVKASLADPVKSLRYE